MWLEPEELSRWAYLYCRDIKDRPEIWKNITDSYWAYCYCRVIKNRPELRKYIKEDKGEMNVVRSRRII